MFESGLTTTILDLIAILKNTIEFLIAFFG